MLPHYDVIILGAGASGLMCAMTAGQRGRRVLVVDHAPKMAEKVRISGGGRCNFTNLYARPERYVSSNPRFCRNILSAYPPKKFVSLLERHRIAWCEKNVGQLFCEGSATLLVEMLRSGCLAAQVEIRLKTAVRGVETLPQGFLVATDSGSVQGHALVVATGGRSIPKMGATGIGYDLARQFGLGVMPQRPGLVPLTFDPVTLKPIQSLAGLSLKARVRCGGHRFEDDLLFTHRGLSGPVILRSSNHWREGDFLEIDLAPDQDLYAQLKAAKGEHPRQEPVTVLTGIVPRNLARQLVESCHTLGRLAEIGDAPLRQLAERVHRWRLLPQGSEGWRTAEVTLGGVDTGDLDSRTLAAKTVPGIYFIGEVVDVTGDLGGFNLQWAWASGHAAGTAV